MWHGVPMPDMVRPFERSCAQVMPATLVATARLWILGVANRRGVWGDTNIFYEKSHTFCIPYTTHTSVPGSGIMPGSQG